MEREADEAYALALEAFEQLFCPEGALYKNYKRLQGELVRSELNRRFWYPTPTFCTKPPEGIKRAEAFINLGSHNGCPLCLFASQRISGSVYQALVSLLPLLPTGSLLLLRQWSLSRPWRCLFRPRWQDAFRP